VDRAGACPAPAPPGPAVHDARLGVVFGGGGAKGAYEAGVALALAARGVVPTAVAGTSSGAFNATLVTAGEAERLAALWRGVRRTDVWDYRAGTVLGGLLPGWLALPLLRGADGLLDLSAFRATLEREVDWARVRRSPVRLLVLATDLRTGAPRRFDNATVTAEALVASATVPGLFPAVPLEGGWLVDGGVVQRAPTLELLAAHPLDRLLVVAAYESEPPDTPAVGPLVERAFELALSREILRDVELARLRYPAVDIRLLRPSEPLRVRPLDFDGPRLGRLVELGEADGRRCLEALAGVR
jgi:NTE family protein